MEQCSVSISGASAWPANESRAWTGDESLNRKTLIESEVLAARLPAIRGTLDVTILGKEGCHLCELVEEEVRSMKEGINSLTVVDIGKDRRLHDKYWMRIPVVTVGGNEVFEAKMMDPEGRWRGTLPSLLAGP